MNKKESKRIYRVKVSFSFSELALIKQRARAVGRTPARFIREGILGKDLKIKKFTPEEKQLFLDTTGIARNLNQLTKLFNMGDSNYIELHYTIKRLLLLLYF